MLSLQSVEPIKNKFRYGHISKNFISFWLKTIFFRMLSSNIMCFSDQMIKLLSFPKVAINLFSGSDRTQWTSPSCADIFHFKSPLKLYFSSYPLDVPIKKPLISSAAVEISSSGLQIMKMFFVFPVFMLISLAFFCVMIHMLSVSLRVNS